MPTVFAPRALLHRRSAIPVTLTSSELHRLIKSLEAEAQQAIEAEQVDFADYLLCRVAELREAAR